MSVLFYAQPLKFESTDQGCFSENVAACCVLWIRLLTHLSVQIRTGLVKTFRSGLLLELLPFCIFESQKV